MAIYKRTNGSLVISAIQPPNTTVVQWNDAASLQVLATDYRGLDSESPDLFHPAKYYNDISEQVLTSYLEFYLQSTNATITANSAGVVTGDYATIASYFRVKLDGVLLTASSDLSFSVVSVTPSLTPAPAIVANIDSSGHFTFSDFKADINDVKVTFRATYKGVSKDLDYSLSKLVGSVTFSTDITNDAQGVPYSSDGNTGDFTDCIAVFSILKNGIDDSANWTITQVATNCTAIASNSNRTASVTAMPGGLSVKSGYVIFTASRTGFTTLSSRFDVFKVIGGESGVVYKLSRSASAITKKNNGTFNPANLYVQAFKNTISFNGYFKVFLSTNNGATYTQNSVYQSSTAENYINYAISGADTTNIKVELYIDEAFNILVDFLVCSISNDGVIGERGSKWIFATDIIDSESNYPSYYIANNVSLPYVIGDVIKLTLADTSAIVDGYYSKFETATGEDIAPNKLFDISGNFSLSSNYSYSGSNSALINGSNDCIVLTPKNYSNCNIASKDYVVSTIYKPIQTCSNWARLFTSYPADVGNPGISIYQHGWSGDNLDFHCIITTDNGSQYDLGVFSLIVNKVYHIAHWRTGSSVHFYCKNITDNIVIFQQNVQISFPILYTNTQFAFGGQPSPNPQRSVYGYFDCTYFAFKTINPGSIPLIEPPITEQAPITVFKQYTNAGWVVADYLKGDPGTAGTTGTPGSPGTPAVVFLLKKTSELFYFDSNGNPAPASQTITFSVLKQSITEATGWVIQIRDTNGVALGSQITGSGDSINLTVAQFTGAGAGALYVDVTATAGSHTDSTKVYRAATGAAGIRGSRPFIRDVAGLSAWSDSEANAAIYAATNSYLRLALDQVTLRNPANNYVVTKSWSGAPSSDINVNNWITGQIADGALLINNSVNALALNVTELSAISSIMGAVEIKDFGGNTGKLWSGISSYPTVGSNTGRGFLIENAGTPKIAFGDFSTANWNGFTVDLVNGFKPYGAFIGSSNIAANSTNAIDIGYSSPVTLPLVPVGSDTSTPWYLLQETVARALPDQPVGTVRVIEFAAQVETTDSTPGFMRFELYKNGVFNSAREINGSNYLVGTPAKSRDSLLLRFLDTGNTNDTYRLGCILTNGSSGQGKTWANTPTFSAISMTVMALLNK